MVASASAGPRSVCAEPFGALKAALAAPAARAAASSGRFCSGIRPNSPLMNFTTEECSLYTWLTVCAAAKGETTMVGMRGPPVSG